ncbi:hypothetical protein U1Q18_023977 [Sarracenia purpurea var. burkii]
MKGEMGRDDGYLPLFETRRVKGRMIYRLFAISVFVNILLIWIYRATHIPTASANQYERLGWIAIFGADLWFGFYWLLTQSLRWNRVYHSTFIHRLSQRYEDELPRVDVFVCTADPAMEPPMMVINTVLSVMAYDYPPEKLSVYLSDDAGSDLTFYALLEASRFSKHWILLCKRFGVDPRSLSAYFSSHSFDSFKANEDKALAPVKKLYEDMENRISSAMKQGRISESISSEHRGFSQWNSFSSRHDHDTILQVPFSPIKFHIHKNKI